jgi:hypothetical protein
MAKDRYDGFGEGIGTKAMHPMAKKSMSEARTKALNVKKEEGSMAKERAQGPALRKRAMVKVRLSPERAKNIGYQITDHKGRVLKEDKYK